MSGIDATAAARTRARSPDEDETAVRPAAKPRIDLPKLVTSVRSANDAVRDAARSFAASDAPIGVINLSLYTDELLDREIESASSRIERLPPNQQAAARELLSRMQAEQVRRAAPHEVSANSITSRSEIDAAVKREATFLFRFGRQLSDVERAKHEGQLRALEMRSEQLHVLEPCDGARPTAVSSSSLHGAHAIELTADELVASIRKGVNLSPADEQRIRSTFDSWRQTSCQQTGQDPARFVSREHYAEVTKTLPTQEEVFQKYFEMMQAMQGSALAGLAFLDSMLRGESLDAAHKRVTSTASLSEAFTTIPVRGAHTTGKGQSVADPKDRAAEDPAVFRRFLDEAFGRGHAADTRVRGVDNHRFVTDPDKVTYGEYRPNADGVRSVQQAVAIFERQTGIKIPPWIKVTVDPKVPGDRMAEYTLVRRGAATDRFQPEDLSDRGVTVNLRPNVLESDEAIVGTLTHELHELLNLQRMLDDGPPMTYQVVRSHIAPNRGQNLHGQAWDVADLEVLIMRNPPGTPEHAAYVARRERVLEAFEQRNHGGQ
ncbi:hypothetical protein AKJ09_06367 [Labilithrix luteola]|uniref:Uncharacterized protein n=1 Tax=Labilithrix luteola TaxID=1391654 RepID=A0A0K1Q1R0_9BACT|nr:hypothetical protein [Labilithrix luteola]AKU99703.1 hypothetical protein AKJ09_06367 [Labilithrix luteola]